MSESADAERVCSAIEETARLLNIPFSREKVWPVLSAYGDALPEAIISFSVASGKRRIGELDYTITIPAGGTDPYTLALANNFVTPEGHPADTWLSDLKERFPLASYLVDSGVVGGFKKVYAFFPQDELQAMGKIADIPSMPSSLAESVSAFAHHGLDSGVRMLAVDYQNKTMNVYFGELPAQSLEPANMRSLIREIGLPEPTEPVLDFARKTFSIYVTYHWDAPGIDRICFAIPPSPKILDLPAEVEPEIDLFARNAPYTYDGERMLIYGITWSPGGEHYKLGSYHQLPARARERLMPREILLDDQE